MQTNLFEPGSSEVNSDRSTNCATTTVLKVGVTPASSNNNSTVICSMQQLKNVFYQNMFNVILTQNSPWKLPLNQGKHFCWTILKMKQFYFSKSVKFCSKFEDESYLSLSNLNDSGASKKKKEFWLKKEFFEAKMENLKNLPHFVLSV